MAKIGRGYIWPDVAGTPTDPSAAFVVGPVFEIGIETDLVCEVAVATLAATAVEFLLEVSFDGQTTWREHEIRSIPGASIATHRIVLHAPEHCAARLSARRIGGGANTDLTVHALARGAAGQPGRDGQPIELDEAGSAGVLAFHTAGATKALADAFAAGDWIPVGPATEARVRFTLSGGATTSADFSIDMTPDGGTTIVPLPVINALSGAGLADVDDRIYVGPGTDGEHTLPRLQVSPGTRIRIRAKKTGAASSCLARVYLYRV